VLPKVGNEADLVPAPNVFASDFRAEPKENPEVGAAGVAADEPPPNLKISDVDDDAPGAMLPNEKDFGCSAATGGCVEVDDVPNWKSEAGLAGSVDGNADVDTLGADMPNWNVLLAVVVVAVAGAPSGLASAALPKLNSDGGSAEDASADFPNEKAKPDFGSSEGFGIEAPMPNVGAADDVVSFLSVAPKENVAAGFAAVDADPKAKTPAPAGFSSAFLMASPKLKLGAASVLSFLSPTAPKATTGAAAKADAKLGGLAASSDLGNADAVETEEDPNANSEGLSDEAVVAAVVVAVVAFADAAAADPKAKSAGGFSVVDASVDVFDAVDPKLKAGALAAGSDFFSPADDEPNEKIAGSGAADETVVVVVVEAVVVVPAAAAVVDDWPKEKENAGLGSEAEVVVAAVVVVVVEAAVVDVSVAAGLAALPNENPPKPEAVVAGGAT